MREQGLIGLDLSAVVGRAILFSVLNAAIWFGIGAGIGKLVGKK